MKKKSFEAQLPEGYEEIFHIDAKNKRLGLILNIWCIVILTAVLVIGVVLLDLRSPIDGNYFAAVMSLLSLLVAVPLYIVLHELTHGIAYKCITGQKLSFGITWSCAYCGVPDIYVYRQGAIIALAAPLALFGLLFLAAAALIYIFVPVAFMPMMLLLGLHLGGCVGDMYMLCLLIFKFKSNKILIKDLGPEQYIYAPNADLIEG